MLRLKSPAGEIPPHLYKELDHLADEFGQGDLRATTRQGIDFAAEFLPKLFDRDKSYNDTMCHSLAAPWYFKR